MNEIKQSMIGVTIDDRYLIEKYLDEGSFGAVFKGSHLKFGKKIRNVAIKIIKESIEPGTESLIFEEAILQARAEANITNSSTLDKMIRVYDFGIMPENRFGFIIMEYVDGGSLQAEMSACRSKMPEDTALKYIKAICEGLSALHHLDPPLIHRDLKPDNILLTPKQNIKIADFGLAVRLKKASGWAKGVAGTYAYMAPETLTAEGISYTQSDVFSIGLIWYEMLTGKLPYQLFEGEELPAGMKGINILHRLRKTIRPISPESMNNTCSERICNILMKCLEYTHTKRYKDAGKLLVAIEAEDLTREDRLRLSENAQKEGDWLRACEMAEKGLSMEPDRRDRCDFLLRKCRTISFARTLDKNQPAEKKQTAAGMFHKLRTENEEMRWLQAKSERRTLLEAELNFYLECEMPLKANILKRKLERLEKE